MDFETIIERQKAFSEKTFGPGSRDAGLIDHIQKELEEIQKSPGDLEEWIDVIILALDGAWRNGYSPDQILDCLIYKQLKNESRTWPDWRFAPTNKAIEHVRAACGEGDSCDECDIISKCLGDK